jgi:hypothetical protein
MNSTKTSEVGLAESWKLIQCWTNVVAYDGRKATLCPTSIFLRDSDVSQGFGVKGNERISAGVIL